MPIEALILVTVIALAGFRLARLVALDDLTEPMRAAVYRRSYHDGMVEPLSRPWSWTYRLISCPHCVGVWLTGLVYLVWMVADSPPWSLVEQGVLVVAAMGLQSFLASKAGS